MTTGFAITPDVVMTEGMQARVRSDIDPRR